MDEHGHLSMEDLESFAIQTFGSSYGPVKATRLYGGAQKVIYKVEFTNGFVCLLYVWDLSMNFFREEILDAEGPGWDSYGANLFAMNHAFLLEHGISTPLLYALNQEQVQYPFDYAFVEFIDGPKLEMCLGQSSGQHLMPQFADMLKRMHSIQRTSYGKINHSEEQHLPCHRHQFQNAHHQISFAAAHIREVADNEERLLQKLHELERSIVPRQQYGFIHGELGPDHVLVRNHTELFLIDIEGASFYDVEHEHSFLQLRFGEHYERHLRNDSLDAQRLAFYQLHQYISLTAAGLKLQQRGFHDPQLAKTILESNLRRTLEFIG